MSDAEKPTSPIKPLDSHASSAGEDGPKPLDSHASSAGDLTTQDSHASGEDITTQDSHASGPTP
ncbi:hypothetical protein [Streptomyces sp. SYSU K217416]